MPEPEDPTEGSPAETPPEGLTPDPALQAEPEAQLEPEGEVAPDGAEEGGVTPEPPAWSKAADVDALFAHEEIVPHITQRVDTARSEGTAEGQKEAQRRMQPLLNQQNAEYQETNSKVSKFVDSWVKLAKAGRERGGLDEGEVDQLMDDHKDTFAVLGRQQAEEGKWSGANGLIFELAQAIKSEDLASEFQPRLSQLRRGLADATLFEDLGKAIASEANKPLKAELAEAKATITRLETEAKAAKRNGQPAPAEPAGVGGKGGHTFEELETLFATNEATPQQEAAYLHQRGERGM